MAWQPPLDEISETHILVEQPDNAELLASLFAIWRRGKVAVLSSNTKQPGAHFRNTMRGVLENLEYSSPNQDTAVILFTSGSTDTPTAIAKTFTQLDAELQLFENLWGARLKESVFVSTVSRQHMYGLPFGLLWPVVRGSAFFTETIHYAQLLETLAKRFPLTLITSPVQLDNLPDNLNWEALKPRLAGIFSAGAPLPAKAAQRCRNQLIPVTEVYGSTETGAVAWRDQTENPLWQCLPDIGIKATDGGQLQIMSPCLNPPNHWFTVADRVKLHSSQAAGLQLFELLGRIDRVAKVGGKRISLTEVESCLKTHPWVTDVRSLQLEKRKFRIGAVLALTAEGRAALIDRGRRAINRLLAAHLGDRVEAVAIPRYWRYVTRLPVDAQGKVSFPLLTTLFFPDQQPLLPEVLERRTTSENKLQLVLRIPDTLFYFNGHFPGNPVLPGLVQINWVQHYGEFFLTGYYRFKRLETLKFQQIIQPGDVVTLTLNWQPSTSRLVFSYVSAESKHSSGHMVFSRKSGVENG